MKCFSAGHLVTKSKKARMEKDHMELRVNNKTTQKNRKQPPPPKETDLIWLVNNTGEKKKERELKFIF